MTENPKTSSVAAAQSEGHQEGSGAPVAADHVGVRSFGPDLALYRLLVESVTDYAIFALDPGGHVLSWNNGAARFKGYTEEEILGKHFSVFYPPDDIARGKPEQLLHIA